MKILADECVLKFTTKHSNEMHFLQRYIATWIDVDALPLRRYHMSLGDQLSDIIGSIASLMDMSLPMLFWIRLICLLSRLSKLIHRRPLHQRMARYRMLDRRTRVSLVYRLGSEKESSLSHDDKLYKKSELESL